MRDDSIGLKEPSMVGDTPPNTLRNDRSGRSEWGRPGCFRDPIEAGVVLK